MKSFKHLKQLIKSAVDEKTYVEVDFNGKTYKEIVINDDIAHDNEIDCTRHIDIDTDYLIINGNGHSIDLNHSPSITISSEGVIIKNFSFKNGRNRSIYNKGMVRIDNCTFTNVGNAIYNEGVLIVDNSLFENNYIHDYYNDTGIISNKCISLIHNSKFVNNHSEKRGTIILNGDTLIVDKCVFKNNSSEYYGGTIINYRIFKSKDEINFSSEDWGITPESACTIKNSVFEDSAKLFKTSWNLNVENCIFRYNKHILDIIHSTIRITGCLFENNDENLIRNDTYLQFDSDVILQDCDFMNNRSGTMAPKETASLFYILHQRNHWKVKNCRFEDNASNYILKCGSASISFEKVSFKGNAFESLLMLKRRFDEKYYGKLKLNDVSFNEELEDIISCDGYLEINDCKFQKHHRINNESVFEIYKSEKKFIDKLK